VVASWALKEWGVDDVVGAFPVHGACGALGLLLPGVLGTQANYAAAYTSAKVGVGWFERRRHGPLG
jgi:ammonia channel protein AmtB